MQDEKSALIEAVTDTTTVVSKLKVRGPDHFSMFSVYYENGGKTPEALDGAKWTSRLDAERAADAYHRGK